MVDYAEQIAKAGLEMRAIELRTDPPFTWASGFKMPIYNDNRLLLQKPELRQLVAKAFQEVIRSLDLQYDWIAGTSTAGIAPATTLADLLVVGEVYVRDKPKDHGMKNQIEGVHAELGLEGRRLILVEDLVSTGGSSVAAVQAIRDAWGVCDNCLSIFSYGLDKATAMFKGELPFDKAESRRLSTPCALNPLLDYGTLVKIARDTGYITTDQVKLLEEWRKDPFGWGEMHGFPKVDKK
jgi:orotate phosphoribosyltransferase